MISLKNTIGFLFISFCITAFSQTPQQKVENATQQINTLMEELHQISRQKNIKGAIAKLDEINDTYKKEIHWETFSKEYRAAKMANPSFEYQLRTDLPQQLEPSFWTDYQRRCDKIMANQDQATEGFTAMVQLNNYDKMMAYGSQIKTTYETFKNAAENLGTANLPKFAYDMHGNMNEFIDNYKKIEQAEIEGIDIQTFKMDFRRMMSKAKINKELYGEYKGFINSNIIAINDYKSYVKYIEDRKNDASTGPLKPLDFTDEFYWNYIDFHNAIEEVCEDMEHYEIECSKLKADIENIKSEARRDWSRVKGNVYASDDEQNKQNVLADNEEKWNEFLEQANKLYNEAYQLYCVDNSAGSASSENPFDGSAANGKLDHKETGKPDIKEEAKEESNSTDFEAPTGATLIGRIFAGNGQGKYCAIEIEKLKSEDKIVFIKESGTLKFVQLIWRKQGGSWETAYQGTKTEFNIEKGIGDMPPGTTHLNFVVNANHNRWSSSDVACSMNVYIVHGGGSEAPSSGSTNIPETKNETAQNDQVQVKPQPNQKPDRQTKPKTNPTNNSVNKEFSSLLSKANESFNKKYWKEEGGTQSSGNPKQESLDLLRRAARMINSEPNAKTRYDMMGQLVSMSTRFAQRVFAYENKLPFINLAGETAARAGGQVSGLKATETQSRVEVQKYAYQKMASAWQQIRGAALTHGGNYSPDYCDKEYVKYKTLAER